MSGFRRALREALVQGRTSPVSVQEQRRAEAGEWENALRKLKAKSQGLSQQVEGLNKQLFQLRDQFANLAKPAPRHLGGDSPSEEIQKKAGACGRAVNRAISLLADGATELEELR